MSKIINNAKYAPGISTYGAPGAQGTAGHNGFSLYYVPYIIEDLDDDTNVVVKTLKNAILNNYIIDRNISEFTALVGRTYQINDLFIFPNSKIYKISSLSTERQTVTFQAVGSIIKDFGLQQNEDFIYNADNKPFIIGYTDADIKDNNAQLNIKSNDNGNYIKIGKNDSSLLISDCSAGIMFDSNIPVIFNNGIFIDDTTDASYITNNTDIYYKITSYKFPIGLNVDVPNNINNEINLASIIKSNTDNVSFSLNILYEDENELCECNILNVNPTATYKLSQNNIKGINLIANYKDNFISKIYKLK